MHAVFKDEDDRVLDGIIEFSPTSHEWQQVRPDAVLCEVYDDDTHVRGRLLAVYSRDVRSGAWHRDLTRVGGV